MVYRQELPNGPGWEGDDGGGTEVVDPLVLQALKPARLATD